MPKWTPSQRNAIDAQNLSLLVSAGAGSGKTTVLTQRIIERIERGDSVMDFLVVTFTNASAADLKEKLYDAINRLAAEHPQERRYRTQLYLLPGAWISTIDSFCIGLVRENFQILGLSPNVRAADEQETKMLAIDAMEETAEEFYEEAGTEGRAADFSLLADTFSDAKGDKKLLETMHALYSRLRAFDDPFGWLEEKGKALLADSRQLETQGDLFRTSIGGHLRDLLEMRFSALADEADGLYVYIASAEGASQNLDAAKFFQAQTRLLADAVKRGYSVFSEAAQGFRMAKIPNIDNGKLSDADKKIYKGERDRIKNEMVRLLNTFVIPPEESAWQFAQTGRVLLAMCEFLRAFDRRYAAAKREKGIMDFADAPHFLLRLLEKDGQPTPFCLSLRKQIKEVYIDEYQDVSPLQDRLFSLLSSGNNRFMVGDVKQSIYRFRNAYPDIFLGYKDRFADHADAKNDPAAREARIFLRENFRCGEKVVRFVNLLFRTSTAGTVYEREYKGEELVFAKETAVEQIPVTIAVAPHEKDKDGAAEREAAYIAEEILRLVGTETRETKDGPVPYRYQDITLLFRRLKGYTAVYERALRERGIPYRVTADTPFFEQPEILLAIAILKAVDDPTDDISLFAMMRSPVANFSAGEVYEIRRAMRESGPLYRAVQHAAEGREEAILPSALSEKCAAFLTELADFRSFAEGMPCHAFLWELYTRCGLLPLCSRKEKRGLLLLYEYARKFENTGYKGLSGFLSYLKTAEEKGIELPGSGEGADADCVLLTSIHKSKGLEYAAVFLCDCDQTMVAGKQGAYTLLRNDGIFFRLRDFERLTVQDTLLNRYAAMAEQEAEYGEELRKLYVACTRARERLYLIGRCERKALEQDGFRPREPRSVLDLALGAIDAEEDPDCRVIVEIGESGEAAAPAVSAPVTEETDPPFLTPEAEEAIRFVYPRSGSGLPAKVSVSALKEGAFSESAAVEYSASALLCAPAFLGEEAAAGSSAADAGTANHLFLQFCRWENVEQNGVRAEIERLRKTRMLEERQLSLLDEQGLETFFRSGLYARMRASSALYREQRFSVRAPASIIGGDEGEEVLLQGVIDCFFAEQDGSMIIVDYKTDRVKDGALLRKKHEIQLACYRLAVEKMTGKPVKETLIWSFFLNKEV